MMDDRWNSYQTDVLFLLVGTNPLPNYVAACLLAKPQTTIVLLPTSDTFEIAKNLRFLFQQVKRKQDLNWDIPEPHEIDHSDASKIYSKVKSLVHEYRSRGTLGLNYTGGTKAMAVHTYRAIYEVHSESVMSYLDARKLAMRIEMSNTPTKTIPIERDCTISLPDLIYLHGYKRPSHLRKKPKAIRLARAILNVHLMGAETEWRKWIDKGLTTLPTTSEFPSLQPVIEQFKTIGDAENVAQFLGFSQLSSCAKWFIGEWLEEIVANALHDIFEEKIIDDYAVDIELNQAGSGRKMQIDAAAMRGYQLFAFSCIATRKKTKAKEHLVEIFVRAQQIGGEEARVGLVCLYENPRALESELQETWLAPQKIRVFGPQELKALPAYIRSWIEEASHP